MSRAALVRCVLSLVATVAISCGALREESLAADQPEREAARPSADTFAARGRALLERGDYVRAEQYLLLALRAGHDERELIDPLLASCIASHRLRAALSHAERHLTRNPRDFRVRYVHAALQRALGRHEAARIDLVRVIEDAPRASDADRLRELAKRELEATR